MIHRIIRCSRLISVGVILQQNDQKKGADKNLESVKMDVQTTSNSDGEFVKENSNTSEEPSIRQNPKEGFSSTYRSVGENVQRDITGWDRVKNLFSKSEQCALNSNMMFVYECAQLGVCFGFFLGGYKEYLKAYNLFMLTNDTTKFFDAKDAKRQLARVGFQAFLKGGLLTGPKIGLLLGLFMFIQTVASEYRGKNGVLEFTLAGAVTTAAMKCNLGIRGMISGSVTGGLAGLIVAPFIYLLLKFNGLTVSESKYLLYSLKKRKEEIVLDNAREAGKDLTSWERVRDQSTRHLPPGLTDDL